MANKVSNELKREEARTTFRFTKVLLIFVVMIAVIALIFFVIGCGSNKAPLEKGFINGYINTAEMESNYLVAQKKAVEDSLPTIAVLFKAAATMEDVHNRHIKERYLKFDNSPKASDFLDSNKLIKKYNTGQSVPFLIDSTKANLENFLGKQSYMVNTVYESLASEAELYKEMDLAKMYIWFLNSEQTAYRLFKDALINYNYASGFTDKYHVCPRCGNIYLYDDGVTTCVICGESASKFITVE